MASLSVRRIDDRVLEKLRVRAAEHGVSVEEEARQIIHREVAAPERLGESAVRCFGGGVASAAAAPSEGFQRVILLAGPSITPPNAAGSPTAPAS